MSAVDGLVPGPTVPRADAAQALRREERPPLGLGGLRGGGGGSAAVAAVVGVLGEAETDALGAPVVHRVVLLQHRLAPNEELGADGLRQRDAHDRRPASVQDDLVTASNVGTGTFGSRVRRRRLQLRRLLSTAAGSIRALGLGLGLGLGRRLGTAGGLGAAGGLFSFLILQLQGRPRVVARQERDGHAPCELKMHGQAAHTSAIRVSLRVQRGFHEAALELRLELVSELRRHRQQ
mmetsp:Transcript_12193/g.31530  ORF Transcript_12193/g.31530 Transcript_12193/m.31530 type:complete len:235 (-) Transcript_12193:505-1209(-)